MVLDFLAILINNNLAQDQPSMYVDFNVFLCWTSDKNAVNECIYFSEWEMLMFVSLKAFEMMNKMEKANTKYVKRIYK